ncbi:MAG: universal stress protein [Alphaproteobacteria bacterium]|nr:universal stress protein [Alphaproteobacteria bacterium]MBU1516642.1 universal stress protein [Alphaproteobacteria bacterium]MBU2094398.1 universal stress protein [Alphaproteobacteria bacterium]MBU2153283.1 universal stress protein [Alphaproteobacteria bacterium]MBU2307569.1 universal stress protein [Alphaproteobacteria bacterium]
MSMILGCIDSSAYGPSVCDHAAWLASNGGAGLDLLHVVEDRDDGPRLLEDARSRLLDNGVQVGRSQIVDGPPASALAEAAAGAEVVVVGKRGLSSAAKCRGLGSNAARLVRRLDVPLCLVSQFYLPIHRGLVLIDGDIAHRRTIDYVAAHPMLSALRIDAIVMTGPGDDAEPKLDLARRTLGPAADVFATSAPDPDTAAAGYMADHQADLIIMSREMLFSDRALLRMEDRAVWAWRTPLFVC